MNNCLPKLPLEAKYATYLTSPAMLEFTRWFLEKTHQIFFLFMKKKKPQVPELLKVTKFTPSSVREFALTLEHTNQPLLDLPVGRPTDSGV